ncbi:MAG: hypothetical protein K2X47_14460, partial [Bdellovibrionales bacterium]|nr:hypothetical protein [Bdellovibrionales bacterium]
VVVFTPFVAPGDRIRARIVESKKNFARAELVEVLSPGPERIPAPCPVFGACGGCQWQHLGLETQRKTKVQLVQEAFSRSGLWTGEVNACLGSPSGWNYRRRVQFKIKNGHIGFFERRSHRLADVANCAIAHPKINEELATLRQNPPDYESVELEVFQDQSVGRSVDQIQGMEFGFSQINAEVNTQMINWALGHIKTWKIQRLFDLYAGRGNFTIPLANQIPELSLTGVELNSKAVEHARKISGPFPNISWVCSDVLSFLSEKHHVEADDLGILLDPPRSGVDEREIPKLAALNPKHILWIGCDLQNLVRDLRRFQSVAAHFSIQEVQPFDMFPQTFHIETAVLLTR